MKKEYVVVLLAVLAGYMLHDQIAKLPLVNKLPTV
jgi:hypothetical protein